MTEDPRRKLIAEAMAHREKTEPGLVLRAVADLVRAAVHFDDDNEGNRMRSVGVRAREQFDRLQAERHALPVAVELIEELTATVESLQETLSESNIMRMQDEWEEWLTERDELRATIAEQAKEIERLNRESGYARHLANTYYQRLEELGEESGQ